MPISKVVIPLFKHILFYPQLRNTTRNLDFQAEQVRDNLYRHVKTLTAIPRYTKNIEGLYQAADYIQREWEEMELQVETQTYKGPDGDSNKYKNLIVGFGPPDAERIILGAHYDADSDTKTPGANDNASGTAGILEVSRLLANNNTKLSKRIDIVAFTNEELPHCALDIKGDPRSVHEQYLTNSGSYHYAQYLKRKNIPVLGMINLDMIGFYSNKANSQKFPINALKLIYPTKADFIIVLGNLDSFDLIQKVKTGMRQNSSIRVHSLSMSPKVLPYIEDSDHRSFYLHGYQAVMLNDTGGFRSSHQHKPTDLAETLDYEKMAEVVKGVYGTLIGL